MVFDPMINVRLCSLMDYLIPQTLKMILILSKSRFETTTDKVMGWLSSLGGNFKRLNGQEFTQELNIDNGVMTHLEFEPDEVNIIWNRRWSNESSTIPGKEKEFAALGPENILNLVSGLWREKRTITNYFLKHLKGKKWTTRPRNMSVNKLEMLELAKQAGLLVPDYMLTTKLETLKEFAKQYEAVITKPSADVTIFQQRPDEEGGAEIGKVLTTKVNIEELEANNVETFHYSFFQEYVEKEFEIRTFYLYGELYSMAIFSQNDDQTSVDFRNYNRDRPNRNVPFKLSDELEKQIIAFMKSAQLNVGSIDIIKAKKGGFYFLEVNPVGQFGMVSHPCNYYLEKKLAKHLIDEDQNKN